VVTRETQRYRQVLSQLVAWQDYRNRMTIVSSEPAMTELETD
jgi:hypothetical protein